jgi:hypothetical protein
MQLATAVLHTLAVRSRAGVSRRELTALAEPAVDMIVAATEPSAALVD